MAIKRNIVDKYIEKYGEVVTIKDKSISSYNEWGDAIDTSSNYKAKAVFNVYSNNNDYNNENIFPSGQKTFFFKSDQCNLGNGNIIVRSEVDDSRFIIRDLLAHGILGKSYVKEAKVDSA